MIIAVAAMATSCTDVLEIDESYDGEVRITSGISTRVIGTQWEANDAIGVYMSSTGGSLGVLGANVEYVTATGDGNFSSTDPLYYPVSGNVDFLAYYPYVDDAIFDATAYSVNVASQTDLPAIDLMTASATEVAKSSAAVNLTFKHKLSNIVLAITPGDGWTTSNLAGLTVKLVGTDTEAAYNLATNDITLGGSVADITLNTAADATSAEGIVIPQTLSGAKLSITTTAGGTVELDIPTVAFVSGYQYVYDVTIDDSGVRFTNATDGTWEDDDDYDAADGVSVPGEVYLFGNCYDSASPAEGSLGQDGSNSWGVASLLSGSELRAEGTEILGVRLYLADEVTNASVWVATELGTPLYTQSFTYKAGGWQYVLFDTPFVITGEDIFIGYTCTGTGYVLGYEEASRTTSSEYLYYQSSWQGTYSLVGSNIYWSMQAIITGGDYSSKTQNDIVVEAVDVESYSIAGESLAVSCEVRNNGIKAAKAITVTCELGGRTVSAIVPDSLLNGQSALVTFSGVVSPNTAGSNTLNISAESSSASSAVTASHFVYAEDLERNAIVVEQFTTANCGYCPYGTSYMSDYIAALTDPSKVVWVAHHAGYGTDGLTLTESSTICTALGVSGAPSCATNRMDVGLGLNFHPYYASTEILASLIDMPAAATLNLTTNYDETTRELTVNVSGRSISTTYANYITVLVKQSGIVMSQTDYNVSGYTDATYVHNNAVRLFLTAAKGDALALDGSGNYSTTYTCTIPDAVGGFDCVAEDMDVVVYIHGDIYTEPDCLVYNADQVSLVGATTPASIKRLYMNNYTQTVKSNSKFIFSNYMDEICVK